MGVKHIQLSKPSRLCTPCENTDLGTKPSNGQEALDFLLQSKMCSEEGPAVDICLMDIEMPVMDGLTATRNIRQYERDRIFSTHIPIIGVSANARAEQQQSMMNAGMSGSSV